MANVSLDWHYIVADEFSSKQKTNPFKELHSRKVPHKRDPEHHVAMSINLNDKTRSIFNVFNNIFHI